MLVRYLAIMKATIAACACFALAFLSPAQAQKRPTIGLALEGGGALALAHVGLIEWLEDHHIPIDYVAGTSMGGLVGGFYASGMTAAEMRRKVGTLDWNKLVNGEADYKSLAFRRKEDDRTLANTTVLGLRHGIDLPGGLNSGQELDLLLNEIALPYGGIASFNDLPTPFRCVAMDLVTAKQQVFSSGPLDRALRATMSIPGYYAPVLKAVAGQSSQEFVDGGLLNNLPVDLVKEMGADIVIAVYMARDPYDPNTPHTAIDVLTRSLTAVTIANERHNIDLADMVVPVNLAGYSVGDFSRAEEIMNRGVEGGEKRKAVLTKFSLDDEDWLAYVQKREMRRKSLLPVPVFVTIEGLDESPGTAAGKNTALAGQLGSYFAGQIGKPLDPAWVEAQIRTIKGMGVFSYLTYAAIERDGKTGLAVYVHRFNSRPLTLQPAVAIDGSDYLNTRASFTARITAADFGGFRSALRTDLMMGSSWGVRSEYFHPFAPLSNWFVAPRVFAENRALDFYEHSRLLAVDREHNAGGGVDVGYSLSNTGEFRFGYEASYVHTITRVGDPAVFPLVSGRYGAAHVSYALDRVDDEIIPHSGMRAHANLRWVDANPDSAKGVPVFDGGSEAFLPWGVRNTVFASMESGTVFNAHNSGLPFFRLGGPQRLSAYGTNELIGNQYFLARVGVMKQINASAPFTDGRVYLVASYEVAKMYGAVKATALPMDGSAGVLLRTLLGPLFVGGSVGDSGHRKWYFQLGRFF